LESADKKYYASRTPLDLGGTREGCKNPTQAFSYRQKANDVTASSNKYYASPEPAPVVSQQMREKKPKLVRLAVPAAGATTPLLVDVVAAFQGGATSIEVTGNSAEIVKARATIDLAVGRSVLLRPQADVVTFITLLDAVVEEKPKAVKKKATKKKTTKKKTTKKKSKVKKENGTTPDELAELISPSAKASKAEWTEDDVAKAFGVSDDDDDSDD
tara:strand:+ start:961 stop:1605 length:645 start_codon:yes stop_codon:yes gene_type:complete